MRPSPDAAFVRIEGLRRSFPVGLGLRRATVLEGVTLDVAAGSTLGLVGPNGSGKSTLLRLLAGVDRPDAGRVTIDGGGVREARRRGRIGFLPEDSPFPSELSPREVIDLSAALAGRPVRSLRTRGAELLARVGLGAVARRPLRTFSRGMLRRFGLAHTFLLEPDLVLLDEPTAGLDAPGFAVVDELLGAARARGATVILSSHLLSDVHGHCDRLAVLIGGRVAAAGTPRELCAEEGRMSLEIDGLDAARLDALARWVAEHGGALRSVRPTGRGLAELYRAHGAESLRP